MSRKSLFDIDIDNFSGQDTRIDPSQAGDASPWQQNFEVVDKGTALATRPGWKQMARVLRHEAADGTKQPCVLSVCLSDEGFAGNLVVVCDGVAHDVVTAMAQTVWQDAVILGTPSSRVVEMWPGSGNDSWWLAGAELSDNARDQVSWRASFLHAFGHAIVFHPFQVPVDFYGAPVDGRYGFPLAADRPIAINESGDIVAPFTCSVETAA